MKVNCNVMFVVGNIEVQSLSVYFKVYIKVEGVMFFIGVDLLCMLELNLMYVKVTLLLCMLFLCWLDAKVYNMMVVCV